MNWIEELDKHGYNTLIDELVWHLEQGRTPVKIALVKRNEICGYEFNFEFGDPMFLKVGSATIDSSWSEAMEICSHYNQLASVNFEPS